MEQSSLTVPSNVVSVIDAGSQVFSAMCGLVIGPSFPETLRTLSTSLRSDEDCLTITDSYRSKAAPCSSKAAMRRKQMPVESTFGLAADAIPPSRIEHANSDTKEWCIGGAYSATNCLQQPKGSTALESGMGRKQTLDTPRDWRARRRLVRTSKLGVVSSSGRSSM